MDLKELLDAIGGITVEEDLQEIYITGISQDSRDVRKGQLFVAISGFESDGHKFINNAIQAGAHAILGERPIQEKLSVPYIRVANSRSALGKLASCFYGYPTKKRKVIGITGTNGKTTTAYLLKHILESNGKSCSLIGTISYIINNRCYKSTNTTPDALRLQKLLSDSRDDYIIMEISSHAIHQSRIEGVELNYGIFTNLSHDHLDYHRTMERYFEEKAKMFLHLKKEGTAIINTLCPWGQKLTNILNERDFSLMKLTRENSDYVILNVHLDKDPYFTLKVKDEYHKINLPLPGLHNVYNTAMSFLTAYEMGIAPSDIKKALSSFPGVPGRFESITHPSGAQFIIDYAHTRDAFEYCLQTAKQQGAKKITHIFGFLGGRDKGKREEMLKTSAHYCDTIFLTLDNLKGHDKHEMETELLELVNREVHGKGKVICDRTSAIQEAWNGAEKDEWVFITGMGVEHYEVPFSLPVLNDKEALLYLQNQMCHRDIM